MTHHKDSILGVTGLEISKEHGLTVTVVQSKTFSDGTVGIVRLGGRPAHQKGKSWEACISVEYFHPTKGERVRAGRLLPGEGASIVGDATLNIMRAAVALAAHTGATEKTRVENKLRGNMLDFHSRMCQLINVGGTAAAALNHVALERPEEQTPALVIPPLDVVEEALYAAFGILPALEQSRRIAHADVHVEGEE